MLVAPNKNVPDLAVIINHRHFAEKAMALHFSALAWRIHWTEEPGGLQSMGSHRVNITEQLSTNYTTQKSLSEVYT